MALLEPAFLAGLCCDDVELRKSFFEMLEKSVGSEWRQRLSYSISTQNWEPLSSTFWLKQVLHLLVRYPDMFYPHRYEFVSTIVTSLAKIGLAPNSPPENRKLAVDLVELITIWQKKANKEAVKVKDVTEGEGTAANALQTQEMMMNFLIRMASASALHSSSSSSSLNPDSPSLSQEEEAALPTKAMSLLKEARVLWGAVTFKFAYFERLLSPVSEQPSIALSGLKILSVVIDEHSLLFALENLSKLQHTVLSSLSNSPSKEIVSAVCLFLTKLLKVVPPTKDTLLSLKHSILKHFQDSSKASKKTGPKSSTSSSSSSSPSSSLLSSSLQFTFPSSPFLQPLQGGKFDSSIQNFYNSLFSFIEKLSSLIESSSSSSSSSLSSSSNANYNHQVYVFVSVLKVLLEVGVPYLDLFLSPLFKIFQRLCKEVGNSSSLLEDTPLSLFQHFFPLPSLCPPPPLLPPHSNPPPSPLEKKQNKQNKKSKEVKEENKKEEKNEEEATSQSSVTSSGAVGSKKVNGEVQMWKITLSLVNSRLHLLTEQRKPFFSSLLSLLETCENEEIVRELLEMLKGWLLSTGTISSPSLSSYDNSLPLLSLKEQSNFILKVCQKSKFMSSSTCPPKPSLTEKERQVYEKERQLQFVFLQLVLFVYKSEKSGRNEMALLEPAFLAGLCCDDVELRKSFFEMLEKSVGSEWRQRLSYSISTQNWEPLSSTFWFLL